MKEAHLRDFIAVVETGSVRAAARKLGLTQAAVSKNLTALERGFGVPLLVRSSHGVETTEYGRVLLRRARLADGELRKAEEEIAALSGSHEGIVSIGLSSTAEWLLASRAIEKFRAARPDSLVSIQGGTAVTMTGLLREGRLDFAIVPTAPKLVGEDLRADRLLSTEMVIVARKGHPRAHASGLAELVDSEWILGARPGDIEPAIVAAFTHAKLPLPRFAVQRDSFSALVFLLMRTDYVSITSWPPVQPFCEAGLLTVIPIDVKLAAMVQYLITSAQRPLTPNAQLLADEFRKAARSHRR
jgi:DNA-binding transcriptional LysR family regulator